MKGFCRGAIKLKNKSLLCHVAFMRAEFALAADSLHRSLWPLSEYFFFLVDKTEFTWNGKKRNLIFLLADCRESVRQRSFFVRYCISGVNMGHCWLQQSQKIDYNDFNKTLSNSNWAIVGRGQFYRLFLQ